jgi:hypothetical protein
MIAIKVEIENENDVGSKIYFDLVFTAGADTFKINSCFAEKGKFGDWMLRLPTKKINGSISQVNWLDDETFKKVCLKVRNYFKEE